MVKKEFTDGTLKQWSELSDIELIELLAQGGNSRSTGRLSSIKALLDKRLKKSIHALTKITERATDEQDRYSIKLVKLTNILVKLTWTLVALTLVVAIATIVLLNT